MRVMLAKILLQKPSLLLLDEPTNHLDLPSIKWIENYLADYEGAVIIVSHDREFLDRTTNTTVEVTGGKLVPYAGNYSYYLEEKEERNLIQKGAFENQQAQIRQAERFIERFKAKASKAKQAQSRVKALDKLERIEDVASDAAKINIKFNFKVEPGRHILRMEHVSKKYDEKLIFRDTNVHIERGDKIALIGANGKGKSTLMRLVAGTEAAHQRQPPAGPQRDYVVLRPAPAGKPDAGQRDFAGDERGRLQAQRDGVALGAGLLPVHGRGGVQENQGAERRRKKPRGPGQNPDFGSQLPAA